MLNEHQVVTDIIAFVPRGNFPRSRLGEKQRGKILASWVTRKLRTIAQFSIRDPEGAEKFRDPPPEPNRASKAGSIMDNSFRQPSPVLFTEPEEYAALQPLAPVPAPKNDEEPVEHYPVSREGTMDDMDPPSLKEADDAEEYQTFKPADDPPPSQNQSRFQQPDYSFLLDEEGPPQRSGHLRVTNTTSVDLGTVPNRTLSPTAVSDIPSRPISGVPSQNDSDTDPYGYKPFKPPPPPGTKSSHSSMHGEQPNFSMPSPTPRKDSLPPPRHSSLSPPVADPVNQRRVQSPPNETYDINDWPEEALLYQSQNP